MTQPDDRVEVVARLSDVQPNFALLTHSLGLCSQCNLSKATSSSLHINDDESAHIDLLSDAYFDAIAVIWRALN